MKKILLALGVVLIITTNISHAEVKIGVVKVDQILKEAPQTDISNKKLEKEFKARTDKLKKSITSLQTKETDYKKNKRYKT
jgi:outer membrane protein